MFSQKLKTSPPEASGRDSAMKHSRRFGTPHSLVLSSILVALMVSLIYTSAVLATEYYVSNSGNDSNTGTSPTYAWRTITKVNSFKFLPGDIIRFERGGIWREGLTPQSGNATGYIKYTSYGLTTKLLPLFMGSVERNSTANWIKAGVNIWSASSIWGDIGNIIFNNGQSFGIKVGQAVDLNAQNKFWYDATNKVVKMYSTQNPAALYTDIELALTWHIIDISYRSYIIFENLQLAYGGAHGIFGYSTHHITIKNCDIYFIGGGYQEGLQQVRYGNGIEFWDNANNNTVQNNRLWEIYDAALTNQSFGTVSQYNIYYTNNKIWNSEYCFEYFTGSSASTIYNIYFIRNTCLAGGEGWAHAQRPDPSGVHLSFVGNNAINIYNFRIENNTFHTAKWTIFNLLWPWNGADGLILRNNLYYQPSDQVLVRWGPRIYYPADFERYKTETGKDAGSTLTIL
ncbi:MAG: hypothetical protein HY752_06960 [Nitrospirae bacterium]|nr:hypothetical protein [Nitrospirota bacterium]